MRPTGSRAATLWKSAARPRASFGTIRELPLRVSSNDDADQALVIARGGRSLHPVAQCNQSYTKSDGRGMPSAVRLSFTAKRLTFSATERR